MKLVITYYSDSEFEGQTIVECLEYESEESFCVDFEKACWSIFNLVQKYRENSEQWRKDKITGKKLTSLELPKYIGSDFVFADVKFDCTNFIWRSEKRENGGKAKYGEPEFHIPEIEELEKWFARKIMEH